MAKRRGKPIMCLDFDGVLHSYTSGWQGARNIPDSPVPGAIEFIIRSQEKFTVAILSSRSHQWGGRRAMKRWLRQHAERHFSQFTGEDLDKRVRNILVTTTEAYLSRHDHFYNLDEMLAKALVRQIKWPLFKPAAMVSIDDRAIRFTGEWPTNDQLWQKPWNKT